MDKMNIKAAEQYIPVQNTSSALAGGVMSNDPARGNVDRISESVSILEAKIASLEDLFGAIVNSSTASDAPKRPHFDCVASVMNNLPERLSDSIDSLHSLEGRLREVLYGQ